MKNKEPLWRLGPRVFLNKHETRTLMLLDSEWRKVKENEVVCFCGGVLVKLRPGFMECDKCHSRVTLKEHRGTKLSYCD